MNLFRFKNYLINVLRGEIINFIFPLYKKKLACNIINVAEG